MDNQTAKYNFPKMSCYNEIIHLMMRKNMNANTDTPAVDAPITTLTKCIVARMKLKNKSLFLTKLPVKKLLSLR